MLNDKNNDDAVFGVPEGEVNFADIIRHARNPIIDLTPFRAMLVEPRGRTRLFQVVLGPFLTLSPAEQDRFIFIGEPHLVRALLNADPDLAPVLTRNQSVEKLLSMPSSH